MIDFSNMLGKTLAHCFVPADQASITFVFQDGMRRSFGVGAGNVTAFEQDNVSEGDIIAAASLDKSAVGIGQSSLLLGTNKGSILFRFKGTPGSLVELPE